jgi:branched-chain amino acid transport system ATP-binding protein
VAVVYAGEDVTGWPAHARARRGLARTFQLPRPFASLTLAENLSVPLEAIAGVTDPREASDRARATLELFGLGAEAERPAGALTQIGLRKLELARAVVAGPRLLIADETMAGLSAAEVDEILRVLLELSGRGITVILIEHVMRAILAFSERVICLEAGVKIAEGGPDEVMRDPQVEKAYLGE